jgi:4'-phosphopantetheinyl transferase
LWRARLSSHRDVLPALEQTMVPDELVGARSFRRARDRDRHIFARGVIRTILARYLDVALDKVEFRYGTYGKPELKGGFLRFNQSHSSDLVVCAVSADVDVGVDIERVRPDVDREVARCLPSSARDSLESLPEAVRQPVFFQGWTRMEAYAKAFGVGLPTVFGAADAFLGPVANLGVPPPDHAVREGHCWLRDFLPLMGYAGALATRGTVGRLECWEWQPEALTPGGRRPREYVPLGYGRQIRYTIRHGIP